MKPEDIVDGIIVQKGNGTAAGNSYYLAITSRAYAFQIRQDATTVNTLAGSAATLGQWQHVVATWDGVNSRLYTNGSEDASQPNTLTGILDSSAAVYIGANDNFEDRKCSSRWFIKK